MSRITNKRGLGRERKDENLLSFLVREKYDDREINEWYNVRNQGELEFVEEVFMKLYVARHGQTVWNAQNKVCGITDVNLTEKGIEQAEQLAEIIPDDIDMIITSPLKRAVETSKIVASKMKVPFHIEELLIEQNYGIYEGVDRKDTRFLNNKRNFAYKYPGGESMMQVAYRVYGFIERIKKEYPQKNILLISHGGVCRIIRTYFTDMTNDEFFHYTLENAKYKEYEV